jgi:protein TonB
MYAGGAYRPAPSPARFTVLFLIAAAHVFLVAAIAILGATRALVEKTKPLFVQFVAPAAEPPSMPHVARVPLPVVRAPEIHLPLPVIDTIAVHQEERPVAANAEPSGSHGVAEAPKAVVATATEPPRFDLAYLNNPAPEYPPLSKRLREEGRVVLRVLVNAAGLVDAIEVLDTSGHARLDETALAAVRRWKFVPARSGGEAIAGWAVVPIAFNLQG